MPFLLEEGVETFFSGVLLQDVDVALVAEGAIALDDVGMVAEELYFEF